MNIGITVEEIIQYINIGFFVCIALRAFIGFLRGTRKSIFYLIATLIVYVGGWLAMGPIVRTVMDFDISSVQNITIPIGDNEFTLVTIRQFMTELLTTYVFVGADISNSVALGLVLGVGELVVRVVYFFILVLFSDTVFKIIFDIIWLIVRPKGKRKKGFLSRLGGLGIGAVKAAFLLLLVFFGVAGLASMVKDVDEALKLTESETTETGTTPKYNLVLLGSNMVLLEEDGSSENNGSVIDNLKEQYGPLFDLLNVFSEYRNTIPGQIYGAFKIEDACLDEYVFDTLFEVNVKAGTGEEAFNSSIKLRKELHTIALAFQELSKNDPNFIDNVTKGDISKIDATSLSTALDHLTELELIKVVVPVGLEVVFLTDYVKGVNESVEGVINSMDLDQLKSLDYASDIKQLGYVFVDAVDLLKYGQGVEELSVLDFDPETVKGMFDKLSELGVIETYTPFVINFILTRDDIKQSIENLGLDSEEVLASINNIDSWGSEVSTLGVILSKVLELGLDGSSIKQLDFSNIKYNKVEELVEAIFDSELMNEALPIFVDYGMNQLGEQYSKYIKIDKDTNWEEELTPLINSALVLMKSGLTNQEGGFDINKIVEKLDDEVIEELGYYLSKSSIVTNGLNGLISELIASGGGSVLEGITIQGFTEEEMAAGQGWSETEIVNIFKAAKSLVSTGILKLADVNSAFDNLDEAKIDEISTYLSQSTFFKRNLSGILDKLIKTTLDGTISDLTVLSENEWTKEELSSVFSSVADLVDLGLINGADAVKNINDYRIDRLAGHISNSKFITNNFGNVIDGLLKNTDLGFEIEGLKEEGVWTRNEITALLKSAKILLDYTGEGKQITDLLYLDDNELINTLLNSKIIANSIRSFIKTNVDNPSGEIDLSIIKGTNKVADDMWGDKALEDVISFNIIDNVLSVDDYQATLDSLSADKMDVYVDGVYVGEIADGNFDFAPFIGTPGDDNNYKFESLPEEGKIEVVAKKSGEIRKIFGAFSLIAKGAISGGTLDSNVLIRNLTSLDDEGIDTICSSVVINDTIKEYLTGSMDSSSYGLVINLGEEDNLADELKPMLKALRLLFGENIDINNLNFEVNDILSKLVALTNDLNAAPGSIVSRVIKTDDPWHINYNNDNSDEVFSKFNDLGLAETAIGTHDVNVIITASTYNKSANNYDLTVTYDSKEFVISDVTISTGNYKAKNALSGYAIELVGRLMKDADGKCFVTDAVVNSLIDYNNYLEEFVEADQVGDILKSKILRDTIIKFITDEAGKPDSSIKMPEGEMKWVDYEELGVRRSGELRSLFTSLQLLFPDGKIDMDNIALNTLFDKSDDDLALFLESKVISETVKSVVIKLDTRNPDGSGDTTIYVDKDKVNVKGWNNEIISLIKAVKFVLGEDADLNTASADVNKVMIATPEEVTTILNSIIVTDTLVKVIYDQSNVNIDGTLKLEEGAIKIPKEDSEHYYTIDSPFWKDKVVTGESFTTTYDDATKTLSVSGDITDRVIQVIYDNNYVGLCEGSSYVFEESVDPDKIGIFVYDKGEVRKIFDGIQTMFEKVDPVTHETVVDIDFDNIKADAILDKNDSQIDIMLDSEVLACTIKDYIVKLDTRSTSGTTTIYVNEGNIVSRHSWGDEIKSLLKSFKLVVEPDIHGNYSLDNASSIDMNAVLAPENKEKLLDSVIISDTLIANLESNSEVYTRTGLDWYGTTGFDGELGKFIDAAELVLKDDGGNIDINNFSEENLTSLTNDITAPNKFAPIGGGHYADEVGIIVNSTVLRDTIASHILDLSSIELVTRETEVTKDSYWNDDGTTPGEIRSLLTSLNILLDGAKLSEFEFNMNTILSKSKVQINTAIAGSDIVSGTVANTLTDTLYTGSLSGMIAEPPIGMERMDYVEADQVNLIYVLKDLNDDYGISYEDFNYATFQSAINCDSDAYFMGGILCESDIIEDSLPMMFKKIINDNTTLTATNRANICNSIDSISNWDNPVVVGDVKEFGELALMFRALETLNTFGDSVSTLDADSMKEPLERLNASKALQSIVPEVLDKALDSVSSWKKTSVTLTPIEYDYEINVLKDLISFVQNDLGGNLSGVTNANDIGGDKLETLICYISESRILDANNINSIVSEALDSTFGSGTYVAGEVVAAEYSSNNSGTMLTTIDTPEKDNALKVAILNISGYENTGYDDYVSNWAVEAHGLNLAITQMGKIEFDKITDYSMTTDEETGTPELYYVNVMRNIGRFLDKCEDTKTLKNSVTNVANKYSVSKGAYPTWELAFVATATSI